jgi:hypothetical protein
MKYCVVLSALENRAKALRCLNDAEVLQTCYDVIRCQTVENVILHPGRLPDGFVAFADEDLYGKMQIFNPLASWIHGADEHGQPICNDVIIWKATPEDVDFMTADEARQICKDLNDRAEEIFTMTMDAVCGSRASAH